MTLRVRSVVMRLATAALPLALAGRPGTLIAQTPADSARRLAAAAQKLREQYGPDSAAAILRIQLARLQLLNRGDTAAYGDALVDLADAFNAAGTAAEHAGHPSLAVNMYASAVDVFAAQGRWNDAVRADLARCGVLFDFAREDLAQPCAANARRQAQRAGDSAFARRAATLSDVLPDPASLSRLANAQSLAGDIAGATRTRIVLAQLYASWGQGPEAVAQADSALTNATRLRDPPTIAEGWQVKGLALLAANEPNSALSTFSEGLREARRLPNLRLTTLDLVGIARSLARRKATGDLRAAVAYFDSAASVSDSILLRVELDEDARLMFTSLDVNLIGDWALTWLARADEAGVGKRRAVLAALGVAERGRAAWGYALARESFLHVNLLRGPGEIVVAMPDVPPAGIDLAAVADSLIRSATQGGTTVLAYLFARDTLLSWLALPSGEIISDKNHFDSLIADEIVRQLHASVGAGRETRGIDLEPTATGGQVESLGALSDMLLRHTMPDQFRARMPSSGELLIVPDAQLNVVPFAALTTDSSGVPLGERYAVRYGTSLQTLRLGSSRDRGIVQRLRATVARAAARSGPAIGRDTSLLIVGDPVMPVIRGTRDSVALPALPGARREAAAIARLFGMRAIVDGAATETAVRRLLPGADLVHLATHGYAFSRRGREGESFLALGQDRLNDGLLTVGELMSDRALELNAELVVLSACQTGLGSYDRLEGTIGLQRAILARGARSVLVSLWRVSDEATQLMMTSFYRHWLADIDRPTKAEALRRAQREVRANASFASPHFWAAFKLVGSR